MVYQNRKSRSFRVRRGVPQGSVFDTTFSLFINDLPASLPSSVSCSLYADDLVIRSSSPSVPTAVEATEGVFFNWRAVLSIDVFFSIRENTRPPVFQWILTKLTFNTTSYSTQLLIFFRTGGALSHLSSSTCRFPQFPPRNLHSLVTLDVFFFLVVT